MNNRLRWQKEKYSRFWLKRVEEYGFDSYCKGLCKIVEEKTPKSVYEIAIGTGWPFAINFIKKGIEVAGSDISKILIDDVNKHFPDIQTSVASYEELSLIKEKFDVVYCFRSTWYFSDIFKAIDSMFNLAVSGGCVIFDIMNEDSPFFKILIFKHRFLLPYTLFKNIVKKFANIFFGKSYLQQDLWNIHEIPVSAKKVDSYLKSKGIKFKKYSINQVENGLNGNFINNGRFNSKIIYDCQVK
jgi:ubiquinone/menaquinone biosynthesis C-methylase UbiE